MGSMIIMSRFLHLLFIKPIHLPIQKKKKKENMNNEWFVDSQKKKRSLTPLVSTKRSTNAPAKPALEAVFQFSSIKKGQNDRRLTRSLWPFHDSGVCRSSHNGHYTLSQPSKKKKHHLTSAHKTRTGRREGGKTFSPHKKQQPQSTHAKA